MRYIWIGLDEEVRTNFFSVYSTVHGGHRKRLKSAMLSIWRILKSDIFLNFFSLNGVKLDADSNGTGPESPGRHLHA